MGVGDVVMRGVGIGSGNYRHVQLAATGDKIAERICAGQPLAAVVKRNPGGIIGHASARAETGSVGVRAAEVIQPEVEIVLAWVVFDQGELRPAHGTVEPTGGIGWLRGDREGGRSDSGCAEEIATVGVLVVWKA